MKKILCTILAVVMTMSILVGCSSKEAQTETAPPAEESVKTEPAKEDSAKEQEEAPEEEEWLPLVKDGEEVTLTIGIVQNTQVDYDTNAYTQYLEEHTGINLKFEFYGNNAAEAIQILGLQVAAQEKLPDILFNFSADREGMLEYGRDGYLVDLTDYFEQYGHYFWEVYNTFSEEQQKRVFANGVDPVTGGFYGYPYADFGPDVDGFQWVAWINEDWLDALGLSAPTNTDELYDVLVAFRDKDPNGNGKNDEVPLVGRAGGWRSDISDYLVNAFVYCDTDYLWNATDGELWAPFVTDEYREAMIYMNKLCSEGLMAEGNFTFSNEEFQALINPAAGVAVAGIFGSWKPETEGYVGLTPMTDATGSGRGGHYVRKESMPSYHTYITADCENPELAFKLLDFFSAPDTANSMRYGVKGEDWERVEGVSYVGGLGGVKVLQADAWGGDRNRTWTAQSARLITPDNRIAVTVDDTFEGRINQKLGAGFQATMAGTTPEERVFNLVYTQEEQEVVTEVKTLLKQYLGEARAKFATGVWDPNDDGAWQSYLDELEKIGMSDYLRVSQSAYDRMNAE